MNDEIQIRPMKKQDASAVMLLSGQLGYPASLTLVGNNIDRIVNAINHCALVAVLGEKTVGWIHAFHIIQIDSAPFVEIGGLIVDENYRNKGIGKRLVQGIESWSIQNNICAIRVRSNVIRDKAHQFYRLLEFHEIKQQKVFQKRLT